MTTPSHTVASSITIDVIEPAELILSVAVNASLTPMSESLTTAVDGVDLPESHVSEVVMTDGTRLHRLTQVPTGTLEVRYSAEVPAMAISRISCASICFMLLPS